MNAGLPHPHRFFFALAALFALLFLAGYGGSNLIAAYIPWHISPALPFESAIPFLPAWSAVYLTVPLLLAASVRWADWRETWALFAVLTAELAAACPFFILLPVQTAYPPRLAEGFWQPWFALADHLSMAHNHLPSLHAAFACTAALAAWRHSAARFALIAPWAAAVVASTLLIHEHHLSDLVCGALLAAAVWHTVGPWARRPDILRRVSAEWQMLLEQAAFARRHRRYALISLILAAYRLRHPACGGLLVSGYCFLQAFDDLMDGDRQTARTADEEARRLIREWRHGRFDENDPYSRLAADFRGRLKTSEAGFCEAKTSEASPREANTGTTDCRQPSNLIQALNTATIIRGIGFTPNGILNGSPLNPLGWSGLLLPQWADYPAQAAQRFHLLPRLAYLAPARVPFEQTISAAELARQAPGLIAVVEQRPDGMWHETQRLMCRG